MPGAESDTCGHCLSDAGPASKRTIRFFEAALANERNFGIPTPTLESAQKALDQWPIGKEFGNDPIIPDQASFMEVAGKVALLRNKYGAQAELADILQKERTEERAPTPKPAPRIEFRKGNLTKEDIRNLANGAGVKTIAVENFLSSMPLEIGEQGNYINFTSDARAYGWNSATQEAIRRGIALAYGHGKKPRATRPKAAKQYGACAVCGRPGVCRIQGLVLCEEDRE